MRLTALVYYVDLLYKILNIVSELNQMDKNAIHSCTR